MADSLNGKRFRIGSIAYFICAVIFAVCIFVQIFIAGWAIFVSPIAWNAVLKSWNLIKGKE